MSKRIDRDDDLAWDDHVELEQFRIQLDALPTGTDPRDDPDAAWRWWKDPMTYVVAALTVVWAVLAALG